MKEKSFTRNRSGGWLSNLGKSVYLILFAWCCIGMTQVTAQVTGSGSTAGSGLISLGELGFGSYAEAFEAAGIVALDLDGNPLDDAALTDPCSCSDIAGCFFDELVVISDSPNETWSITGAADVNIPVPIRRDGTPAIGDNFTPQGSITRPNGTTGFIYSLEVMFCYDTAILPSGGALPNNTIPNGAYTGGVVPPSPGTGFSALVSEETGLYGTLALSSGSVCFGETKPEFRVNNNIATPNGPAAAVANNSGLFPAPAALPNINVPLNGLITPTINAGVNDLFNEIGVNIPNTGTWTIDVNGEQAWSGSVTSSSTTGLIDVMNNIPSMTPLQLMNLGCNVINAGRNTITFSYDPSTATSTGITQDMNGAFRFDGAAASNNRIDGAGSFFCAPLTCAIQFTIDYCPIDNVNGGVNERGDDIGITIHDSGGANNNALDNQVQRVTICPDDPDADEVAAANQNKSFIRFNFDVSNFNISSGDTIIIYDGDDCSTVLFQSTDNIDSGNDINGGWIDATCSNDAGCLTFEFRPKNDGRKSDFRFTYEKRDRAAVVSTPADVALSGKCALNGFANMGALHTVQTLTGDCSYVPPLNPNGVQVAIFANGVLAKTIATPAINEDVGIVGRANTANNGIIDTEDANGNGILDAGEDVGITGIPGTAGNNMLDTEDQNGNGLLDFFQSEDNGLGGGTANDGILNGTEDVNGNGILDIPGIVTWTTNAAGALVGAVDNGVAVAGTNPSVLNDCQFLDANNNGAGNGLLDQGEQIYLVKGDYQFQLFYWEQDPTTTQTIASVTYDVTVTGVAPVCNDEINVSLGTACSVMIQPADVLQNICGAPYNFIAGAGLCAAEAQNYANQAAAFASANQAIANATTAAALAAAIAARDALPAIMPPAGVCSSDPNVLAASAAATAVQIQANAVTGSGSAATAAPIIATQLANARTAAAAAGTTINDIATGANIAGDGIVLVYDIRVDNNQDGDFDDEGDVPMITACGRFEYEATTYMDMNDNGVMDAGDSFIGSCWGFINAEDNTPPDLTIRLKTTAERIADTVQICQVVVPRLEANLILEQDSAAWDQVAVAEAAAIAATAAGALELKPDNPAVIAADSVAQANLMAAMDQATASAQEVIDTMQALTDAMALCDDLKSVFATANGGLIGCADEHITDEQIYQQIVILDNSAVCSNITLDTIITRNFGNECDGTNDITVIINASKTCGSKTSTDTDTLIIPVQRPGVVVPAAVLVDCGGSISPDSTGFPRLDLNGNGMADDDEPMIGSDAYTCSYIAEYDDTNEFASCGAGRKIIRTWRVLDWCPNPPLITTFQQAIEVQDTVAPVIACPAADDLGGVNSPHQITTDDNSCGTTVSGALLAPEATDQCESPIVSTMIAILNASDSTKIGDNLGDVNPLACGDYIAVYQAIDGCDNASDSCFVFFDVVDDINPTAICEDKVHVSLGNGDALIGIDAVNAGSSDNCPDFTIGIRIKGTEDTLAQTVVVSCEGKTTPPSIELVVTDKDGGTNQCWTEVVIEDKIPPVCTPPEDMTANCDDLHFADFITAQGDITGTDLEERLNERFGEAICTDNLDCVELTRKQYIEIDDDDCGAFTLTRMFVAEDWGPTVSDTARQVISILYNPGWTITLPTDTIISCGQDFPEAPAVDQILTTIGFCDRLSVNVSEQLFTGGSDACVKMVRTYTIWNTCGIADSTFNVNIEDDGDLIVNYEETSAERIVYVQTLTAEITEDPTITITGDDPNIVGAASKDGEPTCTEPKIIEVWAADCLENDIPESNLRVIITGPAGDTITPISTEFNEENQLLVEVEVGVGTYTVEAWASDGCGNSAGKIEEITFVDSKAPAIWVLNGIVTEIMPSNGVIDIWANDFLGTIVDCSDYTAGIWHNSLGEAPANCEEAAALGQVVDFNCDFIGTQLVRIYATDANGNCDYVETYIIIQDNGNVCPEDPTTPDNVSQVAGKIVNPAGDLIESVTVAVNGAAMSDDVTTSAAGNFAFTLGNGADYTITPEKNLMPLNGVSTFDLVLISKHILGVDPFDTPYQYIAADINNNGSVTAFDIVQLRQLILNITTEFTNNTSWRFVDESYDFGEDVTTTLTQNFPEIRNINNLAGNMLENNFIGVKIGDINGSATPNSLVQSEVRNAAGTLVLTTADRYVEAGETVEVAFTSENIATTTGYQFTMNYAGLELAELVEGVATANNFNTNLRGAIATSWNGEATASDVLFTVNFTATTNGALSELISVNSDITTAEAYSTTGEALDVALEFTGTATPANFSLEQNQPNPFNGETVIGFTLPQAGAATFKVMDVQGKLLKEITGDYVKGYNQISINAKTLGATGVLHYQLESAEHTATRKMIIIE